MNKEIEIMDFVIKDQNRRNIEKGLVNSSQVDKFNYDVLTQVEMSNRNVAHFNEIKERQVTRKTFNFKGYAKLALLGVTTFALVKLYKFETQPIKIVTNEITADSGFSLTDNGKTITGNMTQEELANYAIENNLTIEQIEEQLSKFSNRENLDYDYVLEEVKEDNEELFKRL